MKKIFYILIAFLSQFISSYNNAANAQLSFHKNAENLQAITKDFITWNNYTYYNIRLAQDFIPLDIDSALIDKKAFLAKLITGNCIPFKINVQHNLPVYKLYTFTSDAGIQSAIKELASSELFYYNMEGKKLPAYHFTDINGIIYNDSTTKGKILLLKCWFIACVACVKEFPALNKLVDDYKRRSDVLFISLAWDSKEELATFISKRKFKYAVVANQKKYVQEGLGINIFPTHILIDKTRTIIKVTNNIEDMLPAIKKETEKTLE